MRAHFQNISYDTFFLWSCLYAIQLRFYCDEAGYIYPFEDEEWTEIMKSQKAFQLVWIRKIYRAENFDWEHFYAHITRYNKLDIFPGERQCKKFNKRCTKEKN